METFRRKPFNQVKTVQDESLDLQPEEVDSTEYGKNMERNGQMIGAYAPWVAFSFDSVRTWNDG